MTLLMECDRDDYNLLVTNRSAIVMVEYTSNCNLRCAYCAVSGPNWIGKDLPQPMADRITQQIIKMKTKLAVIHGHGETTMIEGWEKHARQLADAGVALSICSNLAKIYTDDELLTLAKFKHLAVSLDTVDVALFKKLRRGGDVRHVIFNMARIRAIAKRIKNPISISWSIVCCDKTIWGLEELVELGISLGVNAFTFCNLSDHDTPVGAIETSHISELTQDECRKALDVFTNIKKMCELNRCKYDPKAGLIDTLTQKCATGLVTPVVR